MNRNIYIRLIVFFILISILVTASSILIYKNTNKNKINIECVTTKEDAIEIAKIIFKSVYPQFEYDKSKMECFFNEHKNDLYEENVWVVFCSLGESTLGSGLPEIHIKKDTGEIVFIGLMS